MVLKFGPDDYRMWAYGREVNFGSDYSVFGRSGYFTSADGIRWKAVQGLVALCRLPVLKVHEDFLPVEYAYQAEDGNE